MPPASAGAGAGCPARPAACQCASPRTSPAWVKVIGNSRLLDSRQGTILGSMVTLDRRFMATLLISLALFTAGCQKASSNTSGGQPTGTPAPGASTSASASFTGTWSGTWQRTSPPPGGGSYKFVLTQQGQAITGTLAVTGSACLTDGDVSGSVSADAITMHTVTPAISGGGNATGDYQGTLSGNKITGTLTVSCSLGVGVGTWEVTRQ